MSVLMTRVYDELKLAEGLVDRLRYHRFPHRAVRLITADAGEGEEALKDLLVRAGVHDSAVEDYAQAVLSGKTVVILRAGHKPLGAAKIARGLLSNASSKVTEERFVKDPSKTLSILEDHPRFLTSELALRGMRNAGPVSRGLGPKLLIKNRRASSTMRGGRLVSKFFWPLPLLKRKRSARSAMSGGKYMSRVFWPMPLLSRKTRVPSVLRGGPLMLTSPSR